MEEATAEKDPSERSPFLSMDEQILLWKTQLTWQQEICLLVRHLTDTLIQASAQRAQCLA